MFRLVTVLILVAVAIGLLGQSESSQAAAPRDGVYDIAVLDVGASGGWSDTEFQALEESPGVFAYDWQFVDPQDLESDLDDFDVLIIPWTHDYNWLDSDIADAIVAFVDIGGTLIIHAVNTDGEDELLDAFGAAYMVDWATDSGDQVRIIDAKNPLASTPNKLTDAGLSGWGSSYHSAVVDSGAAWEWAADSPDGIIFGCARFGDGAIVVQGLDPESHEQPNRDTDTLIENEIIVNRGGICAGSQDDDDNDEDEEDERRPPALGGLAGALTSVDTAQRNRERANAAGRAAAAAAAAQTAPPASTVRPPSTGDAGLADADYDINLALPILVMAVSSVAAACALWLRRQR